MPALNTGAARKIVGGEIPSLTSVAFCLEDSILDSQLAEAEEKLSLILADLAAVGKDRLPLVFVRVRTPEHLLLVAEKYAAYAEIITGYVLPKFDTSNMERYLRTAETLPGAWGKAYLMPTLESGGIAGSSMRREALREIKAALGGVHERVMNVRVGGNDLCNLYGVRRNVTQTIYDVGVVRDILVDILNVFSPDYVVSGPVWEYFGGAGWEEGLRRELELDRLNGFVGKTAIHPAQLPVIYEAMKVRRSDYDDALRILGWSEGSLAVAKSGDGSRMNEVKCHARWAQRVAALGSIYGIRET